MVVQRRQRAFVCGDRSAFFRSDGVIQPPSLTDLSSIVAAPDGVVDAYGTAASPTSLAHALVSVSEGGTVYLRGGTHVIDATLDIAADDVTIRNYGSEDAYIRLDSPLHVKAAAQTWLKVSGDGVRFRGLDGGTLRIGSEPTTRDSPDRFTYPDFARIVVTGVAPDDGTFASVYVHDVLDIQYQSVPGGTLTDGLVIWNNGYRFAGVATDGEHMYLQNPVGAPLKSIRKVLFGACYGLTVQVYAESAGQAGIEFRDVLSFGPGASFYMIGWQEWALMRVADSVIYGSDLTLGRAGQPFGTAEITNCTLVDGLQVIEFDTATVTGNTIVTRDANDLGISYKPDPVAPTGEWNGNTYHNPASKTFAIEGDGFKTYAQWKAATGFDADSTHVTALPTVNTQHVRALPAGLTMVAIMAVLNWELLDTVTVDVSALALTTGATYRLRSITNPFNTAPEAENNVITFVYDGSGALSIPMTGRSMAYPFGAEEAIAPLDDKWGAWSLDFVSAP